MARMLLICLFGLLPVSYVMGNCAQQLATSKGFGECMTTFSTFAAQMSNPKMADPNSGMNPAMMFCSDEGKSAFSCMLQYIKECPELKAMMSAGGGGGQPNGGAGGQMGMPDITEMLQGDSIDIFCAMNTGECGNFQKCFNQTSGASMMRRKRGAPMGQNAYVMFQVQSAMYCSNNEIREMFLCMDNALQQCPSDVIPKLEALAEKMLEGMEQPDQVGLMGITKYSKSAAFVTDRCQNMPQGFTQNQCLGQATELDGCYNKIKEMYPKLDQCGVRAMSDKCVMKHITPKCGADVSKFFTDNSEYVFNKLPTRCDPSAASTVLATLSMVLMSLIVTFFL